MTPGEVAERRGEVPPEPRKLGWVLGPPDEVGLIGQIGETYDPFRTLPTLFRLFAEVEDTPDAFAAFAEEYGYLRTGRVQGFLTPHPIPEQYSAWEHARVNLAFAVRLWDALKTGCPDRVIGSQGFPLVAKSDGESLEVAATDSRIDLSGLVADSPREAVQVALRFVVRRGLLRAGVTPTLKVTDAPYGAGLKMTFAVSTLLGAMWLQLALAIDGNCDFRICPVCEKWWDATEARSHKQVCSQKCRSKRTYDRNKQGGGG